MAESCRPRPQSSSGPRRKTTPPSPIRLTSSASSSCIPLLASRPSGSSPPAVTSAVAFGSTSTTPSPGAFSIGLGSTMSQRNRRGSEVVSEDGGSLTPGERLQSNSPWGYFYEQPDSSSGAFENSVNSASSSAAEIAGARLSSRHTVSAPHPQLPHIRPETSNIIDMFGVAIPTTLLERKTENEGNGVGGVLHDQQRFRQSLLGIAFPTTPDTGLNNMPVLCGGNGRDGRGLDSAEGGIGIAHEIMMGGAAAALLAANPHLAPGSLALLTPPDDSGVIEWRREEASSDVIVPVGIQSVRKPPPIHERFDSEVITSGDNSRKRVAGIKKTVDNLDTATPSTKKNENDGEEAGEKSRSVKRDAVSEKDDPAVDKPAKDDKDSPGLPGFAEDGWLGNAMAALFDTPLSVKIDSSTVRMLSYSLPCPLPSTSSTDQSTVTSTSTNSNMLPASAASAPAVAAAAGQQLSPAIAARCYSKVKEHSGSSTPTGLIGVDDGVTTALHTLTNGIQRRHSKEESKRVFIHVHHAISPHIPLNRLPSTPSIGSAFDRPSGGAGGYFSPSVFNSIVVAPGSNTSTPGAGILSVSTPLPNPIMPPSSLHLTLLERLFELSPKGGSLLFIYPTKKGAKDFDRQYLGPVLDPLLRKLMVLYMLREDLLWGIRNMSAINGMRDFEGLKTALKMICRKVSSSQKQKSRDFSGQPNTVFKLVHASKENIPLNDNSWREWWTQQEQLRIREAVKSHMSNLQPPGESSPNSSPKKTSRGPPSTQSAKGPPPSPTSSTSPTSSGMQYSFGYGAPGDLAREVLDGVRAPTVRPSSRGMSEAVVASAMSGTSALGVGGVVGDFDVVSGGIIGERRVKERGIEMGVFVLRREYVN
ncbi:uncharacterized protein LAJ45_07190 [Morchella importuna]|uniref:uncharacterized protein n=1 Tax=Morchella importuna TaxID=1174673 RepID=UPI001E8CEDBC|nr:uncharacterized protein LAJ45_07190 [Morchella importuna]KAH8148847.1 hypothetical protein LAJ45_07190 [Morchella importuna]